MSFLAGLFGGGRKTVPSAAPPAPRISDAAAESAARELHVRAKKKKGVEESFLSSTLGGSGANTGTISRTTLGGP